MDIMTSDEVRRARERLGMTQAEFAAALGLPNPDEGGRVTVARWESGKHAPPRFIGPVIRHLESGAAPA